MPVTSDLMHLNDQSLMFMYDMIDSIDMDVIEMDGPDSYDEYLYLLEHVDLLMTTPHLTFIHDLWINACFALSHLGNSRICRCPTPDLDVQEIMKSCCVETIRRLRKHYNLILQLEDLDSEEEGEGEEGGLLYEHREILRVTRGIEFRLDQLETIVSYTGISQFVFNPELDRQMFKQLEDNIPNPRHVCISNGFEIWCFLLKPEDAWPVRYAELRLVGECVAVSAGLFRFGSDAYMIGGGLEEVQSDDDLEVQSDERYISLCRSFYSKGVDSSSLDTYRLSANPDIARWGQLNKPKFWPIVEKIDARWGQLNKPKFWPIVEKIDGEIHVIDSIPINLMRQRLSPRWKFTHEFFIPGVDDTWTEIETIEDDGICKDKLDYEFYGLDFTTSYILSHLVISNRIYALTESRYLVFESKRWKATPKDGDGDWIDSLSVKHVWDILELDMVTRCVGEFSLGEGRETLYMVIAVCRGSHHCNRWNGYGAIPLAYLVTLAGEVVCFQRLPKTRLLPMTIYSGAIFEEEEEDAKAGKKAMYCAILHGATWNDEGLEFLAIHTFQVDALMEEAGAVGELFGGGKTVGWPVEHEFLRLHVKDKYEYKIISPETSRGVGNGCFNFPRMQACFL